MIKWSLLFNFFRHYECPPFHSVIRIHLISLSYHISVVLQSHFSFMEQMLMLCYCLYVVCKLINKINKSPMQTRVLIGWYSMHPFSVGHPSRPEQSYHSNSAGILRSIIHAYVIMRITTFAIQTCYVLCQTFLVIYLGIV